MNKPVIKLYIEIFPSQRKKNIPESKITPKIVGGPPTKIKSQKSLNSESGSGGKELNSPK